MLYDQHKFAEAVDMYTQALKLDNKSGDCYFNRANAYRNQGILDLALDDYSKAIKINPQDAGAMVKKGITLTLYSSKKKSAKAISLFTKALEIEPNNSEAFVKRGGAFKELGQLEEALRDFTTCIEMPTARAKHRAEAYAQRGAIGVMINKLSTAIADLEQAIALNPRKYKH
eukprot:TRINITY_DN67234_c2_g1_i1.p3 TRINITY_DN67234_c2_g1~~TRINITY_DN67234_c2_g1_i1.p3  ORF type:complete len:172 (+),score=91.85 TRINITY_DN67234_c2_g1_i1:417-932(+)